MNMRADNVAMRRDMVHESVVRAEMERRIAAYLRLTLDQRERRRERYRKSLKYGLPDVKDHAEWL